MGAGGVGAAIGGSALLGGVLGYEGQKKAAEAQRAGQEASIAEMARQFDINQLAYAPYRAAGQAGLSQMLGMLGIQAAFDPTTGEMVAVPGATAAAIPRGASSWAAGQAPGTTAPGLLAGGTGPGGNRIYHPSAGTTLPQPGAAAAQTFAPVAPVATGATGQTAVAPTVLGGAFNPDIITQTPGYQFRLAQGQQALERSAAARGRALSGQQLQALTGYGQGMAAQEFGDYYNRLAALSGIGQTSTAGLSGLGAQTAANIGQAYGNIGAAQGAGILGQYGAIGGAAQGGLSNYLFARYAGLIPPSNPGIVTVGGD
jgi:hypothetical protein